MRLSTPRILIDLIGKIQHGNNIGVLCRSLAAKEPGYLTSRQCSPAPLGILWHDPGQGTVKESKRLQCGAVYARLLTRRHPQVDRLVQLPAIGIMLGQNLRPRFGELRKPGFHDLGDAPMIDLARPFEERGIRSLLDQGMLERVAARCHPCDRVPDRLWHGPERRNNFGLDQHRQIALQALLVVWGASLEDGVCKLASQHCRPLRGLFRRTQVVQARGQRVEQRQRNSWFCVARLRRDNAFKEHFGQFLGEQRDTIGLCNDAAAILVTQQMVSRQIHHNQLRLVGIQRAEGELQRARPYIGPRQPRRAEARSRGEYGQAGDSREGGKRVAQPVNRGRITPL